MKRALIIFFFTFIAYFLFAEGLEILSFEEDQLDTRGSVNPVEDANYDNCALIRMEHNLSGEVQLIDIDVFKREEETGDVVYFYISKWEKSITIITEKYLPYKYSIPVNMESEMTYVLTLFGSEEGDIGPKTGTVRVIPDPIDALITLTGDSGEYFTDSGISKFADIPTGRYRIDISHPQHLSYEDTFNLAEGETKEIDKELAKTDMYFTVQIPIELKSELSIELVNENGEAVKLHKINNRYLVEKVGEYNLNINKGGNTLYTRSINITNQNHPAIEPYFKTYIAPSDGSLLYRNGKKVDEGENLLLVSETKENEIKFKIPKYAGETFYDTLTTKYNEYKLIKGKDYFRKKSGIGSESDQEAVFYGIKLPIIYSPVYRRIYGFEANIFFAGNIDLYEKERGDFNGIALGGFLAGADENFNGIAIGGVLTGAFNFNGIAISFLNMTIKEHTGLQIGFVNYAKKLNGVQIGLVNIVKDGPGGAMPFFPIINVHF